MALTLTEPQFFETRPEVIRREIIAEYERQSGKQLWPADDEMLFINTLAYRETLLRLAAQDTARQNLVALAREPALDYLGHLVGVFRLPAVPATATLEFTVATPATDNLLIPAGVRVSASDSVIFTTDSEALLVAGTDRVRVNATCTQPGVAGNGWQPAQISNLLDNPPGVDLRVAALAPGAGGAERENDEHLRERIMLAPESFSNAGSRGAYRFHAMSAHQDIVDVAVTSPQPGAVKLTPLMRAGLPEPAVLQAVAAFCSDEKVRPLTDSVLTGLPETVSYTIRARLDVFQGRERQAVMAAADSALRTWVADRQSRLGQDIIPSQIIAVLSVPGVYNVVLESPAERVLTEVEWAHCTAIQLLPGGLADG